MVVGPHERDIRRIIGHLKARATQQLAADGLHPFSGNRQQDGTMPSPWGRKCWVVFLYSERHLVQAIKYVADNPLKANGGKVGRSSGLSQRVPSTTRSKLRR
jgi:hypothetical protein